jgi:hypothetical protein
MATLADINKSLEDQQAGNEAQTRVLKRLDRRFDKFFQELREAESESLEADIEGRNQAQEAQRKDNVSTARGGESKGFALPFLGGLSGAGMMGALSGIGSALLKRGIPGLIITMLADEIADFVFENVDGVSKDMRDVVERSLSIGGLGLIFGVKFAAIGAVLGAVLTDDNIEKMHKIGDSFGVLSTKFFKMFDIQLPSIGDILTSITTTVGSALDGIDALLQGDFDGFLAEIDSVAIAMAGLFTLFAPGKAISLALRGLMLPFTAAKAGIMAMLGKNKTDVNALTKDPKGPAGSKGKLKDGTKVTFNKKTGRFHTDKGKMVKAADVTEIGKKFPRLKNLLRVPGLAQAFAALDLFQLLTTPGSVNDKVSGMSGILGGLGGSVLGAMAGTAFAGVLGLGTAGAGLVLAPLLAGLGGMGGYFFGDMIAKGLSQYLLGQNVDAFPEIVNDALNGSGTPATTQSLGTSSPGVPDFISSTPSSRSAVSRATPQSGAAMSDAAGWHAMGAQATGTQIVNAPTNTTVDASTNQGLVTSFGPSVDTTDNMFLSP